jgi:histone acetyltransferase (RNA polymerase elongator complex component)
MDDGVLQKNNRGHKAHDTAQAARLIQSAGLRLTIQMMTGLPGDTVEGAAETAWKIAELRPDAVRVYPAIVLKNTTLAGLYHSGEYIPQQFDDAVEQCARLLEFFTRQDIPVIRLGLHETDSLKQNYVAGPYHPAFRELCEGNALFDKLVPLVEALPQGVVYIKVHSKNISALTGHGRRALLPLEEAGYTPIVTPDDSLGYLEVKVMS